MRPRISVIKPEHRRDQRRPVSLRGSVDGERVEVMDLSLGGVGGRFIVRGDSANLNIRQGQYTNLSLTGPDGQQVSVSIQIRRIYYASGKFGAMFTGLSSSDFDAIERLMFPRRGRAKT